MSRSQIYSELLTNSEIKEKIEKIEQNDKKISDDMEANCITEATVDLLSCSICFSYKFNSFKSMSSGHSLCDVCCMNIFRDKYLKIRQKAQEDGMTANGLDMNYMSDPELIKLFYFDNHKNKLKIPCPICKEIAILGNKNFKAIEIAEKLLELEKKNNEN